MITLVAVASCGHATLGGVSRCTVKGCPVRFNDDLGDRPCRDHQDVSLPVAAVPHGDSEAASPSAAGAPHPPRS